MLEQCPACHSKRLVRGLRLATWFRRPVGAFAPGGPLGLGVDTGDVRAVACADCGVLQFVVTDLTRLERIYHAQQEASLQLDSAMMSP